MGTVYKARQKGLDRLVAVKALGPGVASEEIERFFREARAAARLRHPNIIPIHEVSNEAGYYFYVMDLIEGQTFEQAVKTSRMTLQEGLAIIAKVANAVQFANENGVIHRDLKPSNILLDSLGEPMVADFGLAKDVSTDAGFTRTGQVLGTPGYMAPEQARGNKQPSDTRTDVYGLGATLYFLLSGKAPYEGEDVYDAVYKTINSDPPAPCAINPRIPKDVETICLKALERDRQARYATAKMLAQDIERFLRGEPIQARPVSPLERVRRKLVRHKFVAISSTAVLLLFISAVAWALISTARKSAEDARASKRQQAIKLLESARPALEQAYSYFYNSEARYETLVEKVDKAQTLIETAIQKAPDLALGQYLLGRAWDLKGWDDRAEASYRIAIRLEPSFGLARYHLGRLLLARAYLSTAGIDHRERKARRLEAERLAQQAVTELESAIYGSPGLDDPLARLAAQGMIGYAKEDFSTLLSIARTGMKSFAGTSGVEDFHWLLGIGLTGREQTEAYDRALAIRPKHALALFSRAMARFNAGDPKGALKDYDQLLTMSPRHVHAYQNRGVVRSETGDLKGAIEDYNQVISIQPDYWLVFYNRGVTRSRIQDRAGAIADFDKALELYPTHVDSYINKGVLRLQLGEFQDALSDLTKAAELDPNNYQPYLNRGTVRKRMGNAQEAIEDYTKAISLKPADPIAYYNRGLCKQQMGDTSGAESDVTRALERTADRAQLRTEIEEALRQIRKSPRRQEVHETWRIKFFGWNCAGGDIPPSDWNAVVKSRVLDELVTDSISFDWGTKAPTGKVPADHFAAVAEAEMDLESGEYELRTISDDGIRVWLDDRKVLENWTWHPSTQNVTTARVEKGKHRILVEYFEIHGAARLEFSIRQKQ